jgi:hypothetical protein
MSISTIQVHILTSGDTNIAFFYIVETGWGEKREED